MKQLVILSGKGGTGKTSVTAAFGYLAALDGNQIRVILVDADVDASNLELLLEPEKLEKHEFAGGKVAEIDQELCINCGDCKQICRFDAIHEVDLSYEIDTFACDGCGACVYQCPTNAIHMNPQMAGYWYWSNTPYGPLFHAALRPGQENSGKLVTMVKQQARLLALDEGYQLVLVDGPPGIGCPVISAVSGADLALIVVEPTVAGVHDMQRVLETTDHFNVPAAVCINKADIFPEESTEIESFCRDNGIQVLGRIPFDPMVTESMVQGKTVTFYQPNAPSSQALKKIWSRIVEMLEDDA